MTPFIHLFRSPNKFYFYDVNKDHVLSISEGLYSYLNSNKEIPEDIHIIEELEPSDIENLESLLDQGYLSTNRVQEIRHYHTQDLKFQMLNRMNHLILQVTQSCNLVCSYCPYANKAEGTHERNHSGKKMPFEVAKKSIDLLLECSTEVEEVSISFYGGEPFLNFDLIKQAVAYANEQFIGKKIDYSLTTNGTLLTDEIIAYLCDNRFNVMFSIDGPESIHDANRKRPDGSGSYKEAVNNLKKICNSYGEKAHEKISINAVINPQSDFDEILHIFDDPFFVENKIRIEASLASSDMLDKPLEYQSDFKEKYYYNRFLALLKNFHLVKDLTLDPISQGITDRQMIELLWKDKEQPFLGPISAPGGPCIPGQKRFFVDVYGNFYPCERVNELADETKFGNVWDGIDFQKAEQMLNISRLTEKECKNCFAFRHCSACIRTATDENGFSNKQKLSQCAQIRNKLVDNLRLIALEQEIDSVYKGCST